MQEFDDILFTSPTSYKSQGMITQWFFLGLFGPPHSFLKYIVHTYFSLFAIAAFNMNVVEMFQSYYFSRERFLENFGTNHFHLC